MLISNIEVFQLHPFLPDSPQPFTNPSIKRKITFQALTNTQKRRYLQNGQDIHSMRQGTVFLEWEDILPPLPPKRYIHRETPIQNLRFR